MFYETKELPVTEQQENIAIAFRRGMELVQPVHRLYGTFNANRGCAVCALARGCGLPVGAALYHDGPSRLELYRRFGKELVEEIEDRFEGFGGWRPQSFAKIADWLDAREEN